MALKLETKGLNLGSGGGFNLLVRQDSLMFRDFNMNVIQAAGAPVGDYPEGSFFFNTKDVKLYMTANYKIAHTPDLLWYKYNDSVQDFSSGTKDTGIATGGVTYVTGKYKNALNFDAVNSLLTIPGTMDLKENDNWTISFMLNSPALGAGDKIFFLERYKDATHYFTFYIEEETIKFRWNNGAGETEVTMNDAVGEPGDWVFIQLNYNEDNHNFVTAYIDKDGNSSIDEDVGGPYTIPNIVFTTENFETGRTQVGGIDYGDSPFKIDNLKIWQESRQGTDLTTLNNKTLIDSLDLDKLHWASFTSTVIE